MSTTRAIDNLKVDNSYDRAAITEELGKFNIEVNPSGVVETTYCGRTLSNFAASKIYEAVNFKDAVNALCDVVENIFSPKGYKLVFKAGYQEFKIKGKQHIINNEVFHEMLWLTNSSNGTKTLSVRYGLMRQICSNGAVAFAKDSGAHFAMKHLTTNNINEELSKFMLTLPELNVSKQIKRLEVIANKDITVGELSDALVNKIGKEGNETVWKLLTHKFASSATDRLGTKEDAIIVGIKVPFTEMTQETLDTKIPAWKVFNCYTELWRSLDSAQVERETTKILQILEA